MTVRDIARFFKHRVVHLYNRRFRHWNYILKHDPDAEARPLPEGTEVLRYDDADAVPPDILDKMRETDAERSVQAYLYHIRHKGSVLWVAVRNGTVCSTWLSRQGRHIPRWFIPLQPDDLLLYRGKTAAAARGKGFSPAMTQYIIAHEPGATGSAYADCRIYNHPSIRCLTKAGFRIIGRMRPITEPDRATQP